MSVRQRRNKDEPTVLEVLPEEPKIKHDEITSKGFSLSVRDVVCCVVLFLGTLALRFWRIESPQSVVWDESHFTKFLTW
jgi:dolichyl-phosphate-mannose--protein O-mannosyl transferase